MRSRDKVCRHQAAEVSTNMHNRPRPVYHTKDVSVFHYRQRSTSASHLLRGRTPPSLQELLDADGFDRGAELVQVRWRFTQTSIVTLRDLYHRLPEQVSVRDLRVLIHPFLELLDGQGRQGEFLACRVSC